MDWLLQPEMLTTLIIPAGGGLYWLIGRAIKSLKEFISERADQTDAKVDSYGNRLDVHDLRLDNHDDEIVKLKIEGGWLRGRLGEPLDPKPPEEK